MLTSIDYSKMSDADKAKEADPRTDHDYALSWIRREGNGRLFYMAHGHHERNYAVKPLLEHLLAGMQYALGDLKADDSPSVKAGTKRRPRNRLGGRRPSRCRSPYPLPESSRCGTTAFAQGVVNDCRAQ